MNVHLRTITLPLDMDANEDGVLGTVVNVTMEMMVCYFLWRCVLMCQSKSRGLESFEVSWMSI